MTSDLQKIPTFTEARPFFYEDTPKYNTVETCRQQYIFLPARIREAGLVYLLRRFEETSIIVFAPSCAKTRLLGVMMEELEIPVTTLHSELSQSHRLASLQKFKNGRARVLLATDVASRGLDIPSVELVINFNIPASAKDYVHRIGRTARAGRSGLAICLTTQYDVELQQNIEAHIHKELEKFDCEEDDIFHHLNEALAAKKLAKLRIEEHADQDTARAKRKAVERAQKKEARGPKRQKVFVKRHNFRKGQAKASGGEPAAPGNQKTDKTGE